MLHVELEFNERTLYTAAERVLFDETRIASTCYPAQLYSRFPQNSSRTAVTIRISLLITRAVHKSRADRAASFPSSSIGRNSLTRETNCPGIPTRVPIHLIN